jgi:sulfur-oxidizing protein SoxY
MAVELARREVVAGAMAALAAGALAGRPAAAGTPPFAEVLGAFLDGREPAAGGIILVAPELAENGNMVDVSIEVESAMAGDDQVRQVVLLATRNPVAEVARFRFTERSGRAAVANRIRLSESQDLVALAEMGDGSVRRASRLVRVTVGGCGA